jgi:hypothetical protein
VFGSERLSWCFLSQAREYILRLMGSFDTLWFSDQVQSVSEIIGGDSPRLIITYESGAVSSAGAITNIILACSKPSHSLKNITEHHGCRPTKPAIGD